jgi:hypothetical protein
MVNILRGVHTAKMTVLPTKVQFVNYVIIIKTKVLFPLPSSLWLIFAILFRLFGCIAPKHFEIIWISNLTILIVPGCSRKALCALNLISTSVILDVFGPSAQVQMVSK